MKLLKTLAIVLLLLALVLFGVAIRLARGRRREILAASALWVIVGAILVLLLRRLGGSLVVSHLARTESVAEAAQATWTIGTSLLAQVARTMLLLVFGVAMVRHQTLADPV